MGTEDSPFQTIGHALSKVKIMVKQLQLMLLAELFYSIDWRNFSYYYTE